ncbi:sensor histidine kinase [Schnuerera ultunensis]|uniref:histidine kinase n=1 Tax=[Clostridium] ultunense Esp TaxID=1288971 RepID=A0A1M4PJN7_9FIRM|nr:HAMP domain-containing sensor histidine kinase [Schnuerera ultunensis]SHD75680.1 Sensory transduction protein kinase [[Clostridium] ultunense Esp]
MQLLIMFFSIALLGIFITFYTLHYREVKNITDQLSKINKTKTNSKILMASSNRNLRNLVLEINKTLEEKQKSEIQHRNMDLELRHAIANMSHDLRTPLTSIIGYMQLMDEDNLTCNERKEYMDIITRRAESLQILISSFYDLSRLEAKEYKFELKSVNLSSSLYDSIALYYKDFINKNIEPIIDIDEKISLIIADENAVRRIFSNIIENAIKYGNKYMSITLKEEEDCIITAFTNDAPNLKKEDIDHIFERFFTADTTRGDKSTGLGLAITRELVEQMGHDIYASITDGKINIIIKWKKKLFS